MTTFIFIYLFILLNIVTLTICHPELENAERIQNTNFIYVDDDEDNSEGNDYNLNENKPIERAARDYDSQNANIMNSEYYPDGNQRYKNEKRKREPIQMDKSSKSNELNDLSDLEIQLILSKLSPDELKTLDHLVDNEENLNQQKNKRETAAREHLCEKHKTEHNEEKQYFTNDLPLTNEMKNKRSYISEYYPQSLASKRKTEAHIQAKIAFLREKSKREPAKFQRPAKSIDMKRDKRGTADSEKDLTEITNKEMQNKNEQIKLLEDSFPNTNEDGILSIQPHIRVKRNMVKISNY